MSYYAVAVGRTVGIYDNWDDCKESIHGFKGAKFKKFTILDEAKEFMLKYSDQSTAGNPINSSAPELKIVDLSSCAFDERDNITIGKEGAYMEDFKALNDGEVIVYVDGSFKSKKNEFTYGVVMIDNKGRMMQLSGCGDKSENVLKSMRNVAGELKGSLVATDVAIRMGYTKMYLHYDYKGIGSWITGEWQAKKKGTILYKERMLEMLKYINIHLIKVEGHKGIKYNEMADDLATAAYENTLR